MTTTEAARLRAAKWAFRFAVFMFIVIFGMLLMGSLQLHSQCRQRAVNAEISNKRAAAVRAHMRMQGDYKNSREALDVKVPHCGLFF